MITGWHFFTRYEPWNDGRALFIQGADHTLRRSLVAPLTMVPMGSFERLAEPTLQETMTEVQDGVGSVTGFLQAALDAAWEMGLRPKGHADHTNELTAVRYHLEDMRRIAKVPGAVK